VPESIDIRVRVETMAPGKHKSVGESQSVLIMNDPMVFICASCARRYSLGSWLVT
jgi:hypothetical protein